LEIKFSSHSLSKIEIMKMHGLEISESSVEAVLRTPDRIEAGYGGRLIAQKVFDESRVLRVVYEESGNRKYVITIYPGKRSRYEKDQIQ